MRGKRFTPEDFEGLSSKEQAEPEGGGEEGGGVLDASTPRV
jgi:hypothetical protein